MTRGKLAIVTNNRHIFTSVEFNGDMYIEGYGKDAIRSLDKVSEPGDFAEAVKTFNKEHHNYDDRELVFDISDWYDSMLDMSIDYSDNWFSDYVYLRNLSDEAITIKDTTGKRVRIDTLSTAVFNFGKYTGITNENIDQYDELSTDYSELDSDDIFAIMETGKTCLGIYDDFEDIGRSYCDNVGVDEWLENYIDYEAIGRDAYNDSDSYIELPSGKYARVE